MLDEINILIISVSIILYCTCFYCNMCNFFWGTYRYTQAQISCIGICAYDMFWYTHKMILASLCAFSVAQYFSKGLIVFISPTQLKLRPFV